MQAAHNKQPPGTAEEHIVAAKGWRVRLISRTASYPDSDNLEVTNWSGLWKEQGVGGLSV